ncbi:MAG: pantoate--beta-alanine ligase [Actinomycetota bacterium]
MKVVGTGEDLRRALDRARVDGRTIGIVPTMGALHDGHLSLVQAARARCDVVIVSIFVNPLQFGPQEDFATYPRDERGDLEVLRAAGTEVVFTPSIEEMYPQGASTVVSVGPLGSMLEGEHRPGHFDGVCTVVAKLLHMVEPDVAFFGQKDAQQVAVVKRMVLDLNFGVDIAVCPIVREPDGLAMSSRNAHLSTEERVKATVLYRALQSGRAALDGGAGFETAEKEMLKMLEGGETVEADYARIVDPDTFEDPAPRRSVLLAVAARVGSTRLIDNLHWEPADAAGR